MRGGGGGGANIIYTKIVWERAIGVVWMKRRVELWGEML